MSFSFGSKPAKPPAKQDNTDEWAALLQLAELPKERGNIEEPTAALEVVDDETEQYIQIQKQRQAEEEERQRRYQAADSCSSEDFGTDAGGSNTQTQSSAECVSSVQHDFDDTTTSVNDKPAASLDNHVGGENAAAAPPPMLRHSARRPSSTPAKPFEMDVDDELSRQFAAMAAKAKAAAAAAFSSSSSTTPPPRPPPVTTTVTKLVRFADDEPTTVTKSVRFADGVPAAIATDHGFSRGRGFGAAAAAHGVSRAESATVSPPPAADEVKPSRAFPSSFGGGVTKSSDGFASFKSTTVTPQESAATLPPPIPAPRTLSFGATSGNADLGFGSKSGFCGGSKTTTVPYQEPTVSPPQPVNGAFSAGFGSKISFSGTMSNNSATVSHPKETTVFFGGAETKNKASLGFGTSAGFVGSSKMTTVTPPQPASGFAGFGTKASFGTSNSTTVSQQQATVSPPQPTSGFAGFGTKSGFASTNSTAVSQQQATVSPPQPASGFAGFGTKAGFATTNSTTVSQRPTVSSPQPSSAFGGFSTNSGFGSIKSTTVSQPTIVPDPKPSISYPAAFGTTKPPGSGFGIIDNSTPSPTTVHEKQPAHTVCPQSSIGGGGFSGFRRTAAEFVPSGNIRFAAAAAPAAESSTSNCSNAPTPPGGTAETQQPLQASNARMPGGPFPWGTRPCFKQMLEGGKKKLVLTDPPPAINNYFANQVSQSYGCTYDEMTTTFFATAPGRRGMSDGWITAMSGDSSVEPVRVASGLAVPAAIGVYQPGVSICVVTDKGIFVLERVTDAKGILQSFYSRQVTRRAGHRGISTTAGGGIVTFNRGFIRIFDGNVVNGEERIVAEKNYDTEIKNANIFNHHRSGSPNVSFLDVCENTLAISDLGWHCISLWKIEENKAASTASIQFLRAVDVGSEPHLADTRNRAPVRPGKCAFASGIRLDSDGWVICADAAGRSIQIWDDQLRFVCRVEPPSSGLPYISGLYVENDCHLMVCDRRTEFGGLRCYILEARDIDEPTQAPAPRSQPQRVQRPAAAAPSFGGFAAAARHQQGGF